MKIIFTLRGTKPIKFLESHVSKVLYIIAIIASYILSHMIRNTVICGSDKRSAKRDIAVQNYDFLERTWVKCMVK